MPPPPLTLYVHLPWCVAKCPYCDFNSYAAGESAPRERYLDALIHDISNEATRAGGRQLIAVYLGGGTPSLFRAEEIGRLLDGVAQNFSLTSDVEITMEANPGTVECGDPAGYRSAGVNRLSIGAQSFSQEALKILGRIHSVDDIKRSVDEARAAGFDNINIDVMYGLPNQDVTLALTDVEAALAFEPQHFSWYQLTLEQNTVFHARPPEGMPNNDQSFAIQHAGQELIAERGYEQYEVSAFSKPGLRSRHNVNYWTFGDYLAVGAGAHGKVTAGDGVRRYAKPANPNSYMQAIESGSPQTLAPPIETSELMFEFMLNALRLTGGFDEGLFEARTGVARNRLAEAAAASLKRGLIERDVAGWWAPTALGQRFLNDLQAEFLP
ncbi:MAG: radical SAM family heme chaperone HemW [Gammaproteobacteria bacterium]|nr:radical SAM family heme chaperone HemW [Gammaproteobacteria bacterium]